LKRQGLVSPSLFTRDWHKKPNGKTRTYRISSKKIKRKNMPQPWLRWLIAAAVLLLVGCGKKDESQELQNLMLTVPVQGKEVIGDLGGVPVRIPREFAESVEYNEDPGIIKPRTKPVPERDFSSKIRSFGFYVRYPDMLSLRTEEGRKDRDAQLPGNTFWISAGFNAGEDYPGPGSTERITTATLGRPEAITGALYELAPERTCGLETYVLTGTDTKTGAPNREHSNAEDVFIGRSAAGKATTYIRCSNRPLNAAPCTQHFDLEPQMHAMVYVGYRRGLLCDWQGIQESISNIVSSFKANGKAK
jgi:hypothetical protein